MAPMPGPREAGMGMALTFYGEGSDPHKSKRSLLRQINSMKKINLGARWSSGDGLKCPMVDSDELP